jgi:cysteine desulfuration protein SufE
MNLLNDHNSITTPEEKYEYLIELGSSLPKLQQDQKTNQNKIIECQNRVWLNFETISDKIVITGESDSRLVSGLIAVLIDIYSNKTEVEILEIGTNWLKESNLSLSMTRIKGLDSMVKRILENRNPLS